MIEAMERVLIIDDETAIRRLLRAKLVSEGYRCHEAASPGQAAKWLKANAAEIVILDMEMPGGDGIGTIGQIKEAYPDASVIIATGAGDSSLAIRCMANGADDHLFKPFSPRELSLCVSRAAQKRKLELEIKEYRRRLVQVPDKHLKEMRRTFLDTVEGLIFALEALDRYNAGHSRRVTTLAVGIGSEMELEAADLEDLRCAGLLHDVGKIAVDQLIQNKPGRLTLEEYEHIMTHACVGAGIVRSIANDNVVDVIAHHHDHYDGSGLHQTATGPSIPLGARILGVADAFDAMTSERAYRPAMPVVEAHAEIERQSGFQFDPAVVRAFLQTSVGDRMTGERGEE